MKKMFYTTIAVEIKDTLVRVLNIVAFLMGSAEVTVVGQGVLHEDDAYFVKIYDRIFTFVVYQGHGAIEILEGNKREDNMAWACICRFLVNAGLRKQIDKKWISMMRFNERIVEAFISSSTVSERIALKTQLKTPPCLKAFLNQ